MLANIAWAVGLYITIIIMVMLGRKHNYVCGTPAQTQNSRILHPINPKKLKANYPEAIATNHTHINRIYFLLDC